jgi:hypothetical protein
MIECGVYFGEPFVGWVERQVFVKTAFCIKAKPNIQK